MSDFGEELKRRTKTFCLPIIKFFKIFPETTEADIIKKQLLRSTFSVAANYRARSNAEFYSKLSILVEERMKLFFGLSY